MPRRLANGLTLLSAVVCVGSAMLAGRSVFRADWVAVPMGEAFRGGAGAIDGQLMLWRQFDSGGGGEFSYASEEPAAGRPGFDKIWREELSGVRWLGIGWDRNFFYPADTIVVLPLWLLPLLTAIPPLRWWRLRRRRTRGFAVAPAVTTAVISKP